MAEPIKPTYYPNGPGNQPPYEPNFSGFWDGSTPPVWISAETLIPRGLSTGGFRPPGYPAAFPSVPAGSSALGGYEMGIGVHGIQSPGNPVHSAFDVPPTPATLANPLWANVPYNGAGGRGYPAAWTAGGTPIDPLFIDNGGYGPAPYVGRGGATFRPLPGGGGIWNPPLVVNPATNRPVLVPGDIMFMGSVDIPPGTVMQPGQGVPVAGQPGVTAPAGTVYTPLRPSQVAPFTVPSRAAPAPPVPPVVVANPIGPGALPQYQLNASSLNVGGGARPGGWRPPIGAQPKFPLVTPYNPNLPGPNAFGPQPTLGDVDTRTVYSRGDPTPLGVFQQNLLSAPLKPGFYQFAYGVFTGTGPFGGAGPVGTPPWLVRPGFAARQQAQIEAFLGNAGPLAPDDGGFSGAAFGGTGSFGGGGGSIGVVANPPVSP